MNIHNFFSHKVQNLKDYDSFYIILLCTLFALFCVPFAVLFKFHDPYTTIKWIITLISINFCVFIFLNKSKKIILPRLPNVLLYIIGCILFFIVINSYAHNVPLISYENMRRFVFWGAVVLFFNLFDSQKEESFNKIEKTISLSSAVFLLLVLTQYVLYPNERPYLTFGNINLSVEFIVFSLAFQLGFLIRLWKDEKRSISLNIITSLSLTYIYFAYCRSAYICVALLFFSIICFYKIVWKELLKLIGLSIFFIFSIKTILFFLYPNEIIPIGKNFFIRSLLYINTLKMIIENPLGVGVGQYEFASIPYMGELFPYFNEALIFLSPHDEVLHFLAEDGFILSFFFFLLGVSSLFFFWKEIKNVFKVYPEFLCFSIVLFVQSLFQFPLIEPLPYFMTTIMVGYFFSVIKTDHMTFVLTRGLKFVLLSANLLAFIIFVTYFSSKYIAFNFPHDERLNKIACSFGSRNWLACLNVASSKMKKGDYDAAESYALRTLDWQPLNYQGMKALGFSLLYQGNTRKACKIFNEYDSFFGNQSSLHHLIHRECQSFPQRRS